MPLVAATFQAAVYAGFAWFLRDRWAIASGVALVCCFAQLLYALGHWRSVARWSRIGAGLTLLFAIALVGLYLQSALHMVLAYGLQAQATGKMSAGVVLLALPWLVGVPLWQVRQTGGLSRPWLLGLLLIPVASALWQAHPIQSWPERAELVDVADEAFAQWTGTGRLADRENDTTPAVVLLTPWNGGKAGERVRGEGPGLVAATRDALVRLEVEPDRRPALVLEVVRSLHRSGFLLPTGRGGLLHEQGG
ncbi:MAG: hypothetical protein QGG40_17635, partial [Myxococcota bacterium]|nr:hypothetical protein [Myxococcota bacterium]